MDNINYIQICAGAASFVLLQITVWVCRRLKGEIRAEVKKILQWIDKTTAYLTSDGTYIMFPNSAHTVYVLRTRRYKSSGIRIDDINVSEFFSSKEVKTIRKAAEQKLAACLNETMVSSIETLG